MKSNIFYSSSIIFLSFVLTGNAYASGNGKVIFKGEIISPGCTVKNIDDLHIDLNSDKKSSIIPIEIDIKNCDVGQEAFDIVFHEESTDKNAAKSVLLLDEDLNIIPIDGEQAFDRADDLNDNDTILEFKIKYTPTGSDIKSYKIIEFEYH